MERWTRFVLHHRFIVLGIWIVAFVVAGTAASRLADLLTNRFTLPGTDSQRAEQVLRDHFGQRSTGSFTLVVQSDGAPAGVAPAARRARPPSAPPPSCRRESSSPSRRSPTR